MIVIKIGDYIKEQRTKLDLTQEELCEGICTAATLSRLENNQQTPTRNRINAILQRLGLPDDRFFALLSENEEQIEVLQKKINAGQISFRRAGQEERNDIRKDVLSDVADLELIVEEDDRITQQYVLGVKADLGRPEGPYSLDEQLEMLMTAIQLTIPQFDLDKIGGKRYSIEEATLVNQIAVTYKRSGQKRKAIDIYSQLLKYLEENDQQLARYAGHYCLVVHNYAIALSSEKRYEEAIELSMKGKQICTEYGDYQFLPGFLAILAECYYFIGDWDESKRLYILAYCLYAAVNDQDNLNIIKKEMKERLNLDPPI